MRRHLTYANAMATILAIVVIGGGASAAGKHIDITARKIRPASVGEAKLREGVVTASKLADGAVWTGNIADMAVTAPKLAPGAVGYEHLDDFVKSYWAPASRRLSYSTGLCHFNSPNSTCSADVLDVAGLTLHATCIPSFSGFDIETLKVDVTHSDGAVNFSMQSGGGTTGGPSGSGPVDIEQQRGFAGTGTMFTINTLDAGGFSDIGPRRAIGSVVYRNFSSGQIVAIDFSAFVDNSDHRCEFLGSAGR